MTSTLYVYKQVRKYLSERITERELLTVLSTNSPAPTHNLFNNPQGSVLETLTLALLSLAPNHSPRSEILVLTSPLLWEEIRRREMRIPQNTPDTELRYVFGGRLVTVSSLLETDDHRFLCLFDKEKHFPRELSEQFQTTESRFVTPTGERLFSVYEEGPVVCLCREPSFDLPLVQKL